MFCPWATCLHQGAQAQLFVDSLKDWAFTSDYQTQAVCYICYFNYRSVTVYLHHFLYQDFSVKTQGTYHFAEHWAKDLGVLKTGSLTSVSFRLYWETKQTLKKDLEDNLR